MKVFGICGSPRAQGNSEWALMQLLEAYKKNGAQTDYVLLSKTNVRLCDGSLPEDLKTDSEEDMKEIKANMLDADVIVFASPTYFDNITPQLVNLIARTDPFYEELKGKDAIIMVVGQANDQSRMTAANVLRNYCEIAEMHVKGIETFRATNKGDVQFINDVDKIISRLAK